MRQERGGGGQEPENKTMLYLTSIIAVKDKVIYKHTFLFTYGMTYMWSCKTTRNAMSQNNKEVQTCEWEQGLWSHTVGVQLLKQQADSFFLIENLTEIIIGSHASYRI